MMPSQKVCDWSLSLSKCAGRNSALFEALYPKFAIFGVKTYFCVIMSALYSRFMALAASVFAASVLVVGCGGSDSEKKEEPYVLPVEEVNFARGADISGASEMEYDMVHNPSRINGAAFRDAKGNTGLFPVLKGAGVNAIRLRVWVKPEDANGWSGKDDVVTMAKRAVEAGMSVMIDFHYSDFFADPGRQNTPADWVGLDLNGLSAKVAGHTKGILSALKSTGVAPLWVQVGNETRPGMLWETGRIYNDKGEIAGGWKNYATLNNAGYDAVKEIFPKAQVIVHIDNAYQDNTWFFDKLKASGGKFDMIGLSHYPMTNPQMTWKAMNSAAILNIKSLAAKYGCKVMVCEIGVKDSAEALAASTQCMTEFMNSVKSLSICAGVFYWEPQVDGKWRPSIYEKQDRNWGAYNMGAFTSDGSALSPTSILVPFAE